MKQCLSVDCFAAENTMHVHPSLPLLGDESLLPDQGQGLVGHIIGPEKAPVAKCSMTGNCAERIETRKLRARRAWSKSTADLGQQDQGGTVDDPLDRRCHVSSSPS